MPHDPVHDAVQAALAAETPAAPAPVPTAPSTSLSTDAVAAKKQLEAWMPDRTSPYWRGDGVHSAEWLQEHYRGLIRAEQQSAPDAVGPEHTFDLDLPVSPERYDLSGVGRSFKAEDAEGLAAFLPVAHGLGLGQKRTARLVGYVLQTPEMSPASFRYWAVSEGYSDSTIDALLAWHAKELA